LDFGEAQQAREEKSQKENVYETCLFVGEHEGFEEYIM